MSQFEQEHGQLPVSGYAMPSRPISDHDLTFDLAQILIEEAARSLPRDQRCAMRLDLGKP